MRVVQLSAKADTDGRLRFEIPAEAGAEFEVAVIVQPSAVANGAVRKPTPEELGWPPGYFENVIGSIDDPAFKRSPQEELEVRETLE